MSPYGEALQWIERHPGTGSALALGKLLLSLWNDQCCFSFRECVRSLDEERTALALRVVQHFAATGEDAELVRAGYAVHEHFPRLWEQAEAASSVRWALAAKWEKDDAEAQENGSVRND